MPLPMHTNTTLNDKNNMLKINSFQNFGGGISYYLAPDVEVCELAVEQGFAASDPGSSWDDSIDKPTWGDGDDDLF